jgi:hypothetical protein
VAEKPRGLAVEYVTYAVVNSTSLLLLYAFHSIHRLQNHFSGP